MTRRGRPIALLALVALPIGSSAIVWRWATDVDAARPGPPPAVVSLDPEVDATAGEPLLSARRLPGPLVDEVTDRVVRDAVRSFTDRAGSDASGPACASIRRSGVELAGPAATTTVSSEIVDRLAVAIAAVTEAGPDARFTTVVAGAAPVDGVVTGDLVLVGAGDPMVFSDDGDVARPDPGLVTRLDDLADQLVALGVREVTGDIVGDGTRYGDDPWRTIGTDVPRDEAIPVGALVVNGGRLLGSGIGLNPPQAAASEFARLLTGRGISIAGRNRSVTEPAAPDDDRDVVAAIGSVPLVDLAVVGVRDADDRVLDTLLLELDALGAPDRPATRDAGIARARSVLGLAAPIEAETIATRHGVLGPVACDVLADLVSTTSGEHADATTDATTDATSEARARAADLVIGALDGDGVTVLTDAAGSLVIADVVGTSVELRVVAMLAADGPGARAFVRELTAVASTPTPSIGDLGPRS